jgi:hypothetical protein
MLDVGQTILSQFANSPSLAALLEAVNAYLDPRADFQLFYDAVMNIDTAQGYGLDVWGRIVGIGRVVQVSVTPLSFGFAEAGKFNAIGFEESVSGGAGGFWDGSSALTQPFSLLDADYRRLLLAKALFNITDCSIPAINQILLNLFPGRGNCWVEDGQDMTMTYRFSFGLTSLENAILSQTGVLPKPTGVLATVISA